MYLKRMLENEKKKKNKKPIKKAHLNTQGDEDMSFDDEKEKEKEALLYLMAFKYDENQVNDLNSYISKDHIGDLYIKHYDDLIKAKKNIYMLKKIIISLESIIKILQKEMRL